MKFSPEVTDAAGRASSHDAPVGQNHAHSQTSNHKSDAANLFYSRPSE